MDLTDGRFLDVCPIRVCFPSGLKGRSRIPVLDVFFDGQQVADKSKRPKKGRIDVQSSSSPKASRGQRRKAFPKVNRNARRFCLFDAFRTLVDRPKSVQKASVGQIYVC